MIYHLDADAAQIAASVLTTTADADVTTDAVTASSAATPAGGLLSFFSSAAITETMDVDVTTDAATASSAEIPAA